MEKEITKVLMFKQSSIGDCLMAKYFLENVRAQYPHARFGIVVGSRGAMIQDALAAYPWIEVMETNRRSVGSLWRLFRRFGGSNLVVTEYTGGQIGLGTKLVARLLAYKGRLIGFDDMWPYTKYFYNTLIPLGGRHEAPRFLEQQALAAAGIPVTKEWLTYDYVQQPGLLSRFGVEKKRYLVVHLFSGSIARGLSPDRQQDLLNQLVKIFPNMPLLLTGTQKERSELAKLSLPAQSTLVATTVQEVAGLMDNSACVVAVGTGVSHMASHMRVPLVVMVNCINVKWVGKEQWGDAPMAVFTGPVQCQHGQDAAGYSRCLNSIDMSAVAEAAKKFADHAHT